MGLFILKKKIFHLSLCVYRRILRYCKFHLTLNIFLDSRPTHTVTGTKRSLLLAAAAAAEQKAANQDDFDHMLSEDEAEEAAAARPSKRRRGPGFAHEEGEGGMGRVAKPKKNATAAKTAATKNAAAYAAAAASSCKCICSCRGYLCTRGHRRASEVSVWPCICC